MRKAGASSLLIRCYKEIRTIEVASSFQLPVSKPQGGGWKLGAGSWQLLHLSQRPCDDAGFLAVHCDDDLHQVVAGRERREAEATPHHPRIGRTGHLQDVAGGG